VEGIYKQWTEAEKQFNLALTTPKGGELIGHTQCDWRWDRHCAYISVVIAPGHQRQGFGAEVIHILLEYLFGYTQAHNVSSGMASWNKTALQFSSSQGFTQIGAMRRAGLRGGEYYDWIGVDIIRPEWKAGKGG
jgi:RimJ/RimL family protein N-acetyltransferase